MRQAWPETVVLISLLLLFIKIRRTKSRTLLFLFILRSNTAHYSHEQQGMNALPNTVHSASAL
ncbi:hypothetical protein B9T34_10670 [Acinetobacter sp. ANC 3813]|nr:hypothetical protein B9T34_10670 [Acinetobacter sp. ANC 3813]